MAPLEKRMRALKIAFATTLLGLAQVDTAAAEDKLTVGVALPRAQLGQPNGASADVAEPVRQVLMSYLKGPVIEVVALEARIPVQIAAEAREKGCAFVLYTDVSQTAKGGGLKMLKKLAPMAGMVPMALALGEGAAAVAPLGRAVIGGLLTATVATLLVLPSVYSLIQQAAAPGSPSLDPDDPDSAFRTPAV